MTPRPVSIHGVLRDYDWGIIDGLSTWGGTLTGGPQAELWFGGHPSAPSPTVANAERTLVDEWPDEPAPLLTKILAAESPLSLQVHPTAERVAEWWSDPGSSALLSDRAEKTEMLIALAPFTVLLGWRAEPVSSALLEAAGADAPVLEAVERGDRRAAIRLLLGEHQLSVPAQTWTSAAEQVGLGDVAVGVFPAICRRFGTDPGVAVAALLNSARLETGDAAYVPAGVPHAYIHGLGVEVMNSSDNVLRLGLTAKTLSVEHALAALDLAALPELIRRPTDGWYRPPGSPFNALALADGEHVLDTDSYRLVLCLSGGVVAAVAGDEYRLGVGEALALPSESDAARLLVSGTAVAVWATKDSP